MTFDFPDGVRVYIFPSFNETYVGFLPSELRAMGGIAEVMPRGVRRPGTALSRRANGTGHFR